MCYWILPASGHVQSHTTVQHVTQEDHADAETRQKIDSFYEQVKQRLNDPNYQLYIDHATDRMFLDDEPIDPVHSDQPDYSDTFPGPLMNDEDDEDSGVDHYLNVEVILETDNGPTFGKVVDRAKHPDGRKIGNPHRNPLFDTREYLVEFPDQSRQRYSANTIAENLFAQCDSEGNRFRVLEEITDHRMTASAPSGDARYRVLRNGQKVPRKTVKGWEYCGKYEGGETEWIDLQTVKDANPVEAAEYAIGAGLGTEPAFTWWVHDVMKHKHRIIAKVKSRYWTTTHKYGVKLPHSVEEALEIDRLTGTDYWAKAIAKENKKVKVSWHALHHLTPEQVRTGQAHELIGYQEIKCHMVFDVKMDFTRKARFVAQGNRTDTPASITYSSVVSRDSVRLAFLIAALNDLDLLACDVSNAYLNAPCREKIWFVGGKDTGEDEGKVLVVDRALYGLKSSGASWRAMLAKTLTEEFGFVPTKADDDVYRRPAEKDGFKYYEYIFVYVDDLLIVSKDPRHWITRLQASYELKEESVGPPETYLGAQVGQMQLPDGRLTWYMSPDKYVKNAIDVVQRLLDEDGNGLQIQGAKTPYPSGYKPELDVTAEVDAAGLSRFRQLIGILRWAVELGRLDIYLETSLLSQYMASPRVGHLEVAYHMFAYLKTHPRQRIAMDDADPNIDERRFKVVDWTDFYGDVVEELPPRMPEPRGNAVTIHCFVDADHAGNSVTRRSHTGILIFVQNAPILWFSKRQNTVEPSTFGSELVAMRIAKEMIVGLRYKLRMFGVPISGPANVFCDNQGVVKNTSLPESTLAKKHNSINYHTVREAVAAGIMRVTKEDTETNLSDLFTKPLSRSRRNFLLSMIVWGPQFQEDWLAAGGQKRKFQDI